MIVIIGIGVIATVIQINRRLNQLRIEVCVLNADMEHKCQNVQ